MGMGGVQRAHQGSKTRGAVCSCPQGGIIARGVKRSQRFIFLHGCGDRFAKGWAKGLRRHGQRQRAEHGKRHNQRQGGTGIFELQRRPSKNVFFSKLCRTQRFWASQSCVTARKIRRFGGIGMKIHRFWGRARVRWENILQFIHPRRRTETFSNFSPMPAKLTFATLLSALCFAIVMPYLCGIVNMA